MDECLIEIQVTWAFQLVEPKLGLPNLVEHQKQVDLPSGSPNLELVQLLETTKQARLGISQSQPLGSSLALFSTWWFIPLSKWVITPVISGLTLLIPFITGVITHLLSGMSHQVLVH
jgi:hypothetical protein